MAFVMAHPAPPSRENTEDSISAALHAALQPFSIGGSSLQHHPQQQQQQTPTPAHANPPCTTGDHSDMHKEKGEKGHSSVDIVVSSDTLILRGTGVDVNPALLSGNVVLHLTEATSIKEITLQFRGKARIPPSANESLSINSAPLTYVVCNHEWSFLEGTRSHSHTLKAGRHLFPFQLQIGGSLPSSVSTSALGGASVQYKLRATVVRPGFGLTHRDLQAVHPIHILRGFGPEALEYQQTLEIENTWPEKLMYSIMIPHKAWAAGDRVTAVVKFSPLVKGARVQYVNTMVNETVKLYGRMGVQETTRTIANAKHEFVGGQAVLMEETHHRQRVSLLHHHAHSTRTSGSTPMSGPHTPSTSGGSYFPSQPLVHTPSETMPPLSTVTTNSSTSSSGSNRGASTSAVASPPAQYSAAASSSNILHGVELPPEVENEPSQDVITTLHVAIPAHATPGHALEPIQVSHRIRWSIMIANLDGHTSELRCSLPLHILDNRLFSEAHSASLATRRLLLGSHDVEGGQAVGTHGETSDDEDDMELPSYPAHVRDRVANAFLPDLGVMRVTNPWVANGVSPVIFRRSRSGGSSGVQSPGGLECFPVEGHGHDIAHLPQAPTSGSPQLDWVNSELLLSLSQQPDAPTIPPQRSSPSESRVSPSNRTPPESSRVSRIGSRFSSRHPSRAGSRANSRSGSPERTSQDGHRPAVAHADTFVHNSSTASRNLHGLFHISMKPFSSITSGFSLGHRSSSHASLPHSGGHHHGHGSSHHSSSTDVRGRGTTSGTSTPHSGLMSPTGQPLNVATRGLTTDPVTGQYLLHRAFVETPDYEVASRGFLGGGVPPLSSYTGLPSYEEAAHDNTSSRDDSSTSGEGEGDLVGQLASALEVAQRQQEVTTAH